MPRGATYEVFRLRPDDPEGIAQCRSLVHEARSAGRNCLVGLYVADRASYHRPAAELLRSVDALLGTLDVREVAGVVIGQDNVPWDRGLETLNAVYDHIKKQHSDLPVYQWYAAPLPPHHKQRADGWVVSPGAMDKAAVRRYLMKYLVTGKPVVNCVAAAGASADGPNDLLALCHELNVPATFLPTASRADGGGAAQPSRDPGPTVGKAYALHTLWRQLPPEADRAEGHPIEVGGDRVKRFEYRETFEQQWFIGDPTIEGVSCLRWDPAASALHIEGRGGRRRRVVLTYHFSSPWHTKELISELEGSIQGTREDCVELSLSRDGRRFIHPARALGRQDGNPFHLTDTASYRLDGEEWWVRIAATVAPRSRCTLTLFRANCRTKPPGRQEVALAPATDGRLAYRETFDSSKILHLAEIQNLTALEWQRGGVFIRGRSGGPVEVVLRQKFVSPEPLRAVAIRIRNAAIRSEVQGTNVFGISIDGSSLLARKTTPGAEARFTGTTELRVTDAARLAGTRHFYLHIVLTNEAGAETDPSNILSQIEIEAETAGGTTRTAAAPAHTIALR